MPYKSEKIRIAGTKYDRRAKLTDDERMEIKRIRKEEGLGYQRIANMFGVSKRLVQFICNPDLAEKNRQRLKEKKSEGLYKYGHKEWAETIREHRRYKQLLYVSGKIKENYE